jgi:hypothetical protein
VIFVHFFEKVKNATQLSAAQKKNTLQMPSNFTRKVDLFYSLAREAPKLVAKCAIATQNTPKKQSVLLGEISTG